MNAGKLIKTKVLKLFGNLAHFSQAPAQTQKNFCTPELFGQRLALEKRKAERLGCKFSMIVLSLKAYLDKNADCNGDLKNEVRQILGLICSEIRETDLVGLCHDEMVSILLPDTDNFGAQCACQRVVRKLLQSHRAGVGMNNVSSSDLAIEIISYPEKARKELQEKATTERRNGKLPAPIQRPVDAVDFEVQYYHQMNICVGKSVTLPIATSLPQAFFWDQQLIWSFSLAAKRILKRAMDIIGAAMGLLLFAPLMITVGLLIKATSSGPILYKQRRLGYMGQPFTFLKFRSMYHNCDENLHLEYVKKLVKGKTHEINNGSAENPFYKITNDPRITPLGSFLRKTSIDELPQFWNVLKGQMSLVGPRPAITYEVEEYQNWHYRRILEVKPGMTGLWQVSGRSRTTFDEMVRLDIQYARDWSIALDIKVLFKTIQEVLSADGT